MFSEGSACSGRSASAKEYIQKRIHKELLQAGREYLPETVHIDGLNAIITLEVALVRISYFLAAGMVCCGIWPDYGGNIPHHR